MPASSSDTRPLVIVRADASAAIGLGHVMRSLTLAGALAEEGCDVRFIGAGIPAAAGSNLPGAVQVSDRPEVAGDEVDAASVQAERPDLVVVDGYHFTAVFFRALEDAGTPYAVIDDNLETSARAPVLVLNQNPHASAELYGELQGAPALLLGLEYALVRPEIVATAQLDLAREPGVVFVSMGGSDPLGLTLPIVERLARPGVRVLVALGPAHPSRTETSERLTGLDGVHVIAPDEYVTALATAEIAVLAAGSSIWEAACLGTPTISVVVADNQRKASSAAHQSGQILLADATTDFDPATTVLGFARDLLYDCDSREQLSAASSLSVGLSGANRAARVLFDLADGEKEGSDASATGLS